MAGYLRKFYLSLNARSFPVSEGRPGSEETVMASSGLDTGARGNRDQTGSETGDKNQFC